MRDTLQPVASPDFKAAARRHHDDAHFLLGDNRWANADHLARLAAECALKAIIQCAPFGAATNAKGIPMWGQPTNKPFNAPAGVMLASTMFAPEQVLDARDLVTVRERTHDSGCVSTLERGVVGAEWLHPRTDEDPAGFHRVTLYGFKGGVGRSSATFMLAQHLASQGKSVLVVDLDLESPGVGSLLQDDSDLPDYGVVDYLAESAVGNANGLDLVTKSQTVRVSGNGEVWVAPAGGRPREDYDYLAKLNRAYLDLPASIPDGPPQTLANRLESAVSACEHRVAELSRRPDFTLLDSRAGIHDIAAIAITQLADDSLLFATDSPATWNGYRELFRQWGQVPERAQAIRKRLRMVAAMVPLSCSTSLPMTTTRHTRRCRSSSPRISLPWTLRHDVPGMRSTQGLTPVSWMGRWSLSWETSHDNEPGSR
jgi:hypothetical protein